MSDPASRPKRVKHGVTLMSSVLLFVIFIMSGASKLIASEFATEGFDGWGYPIWFMYAVGLAEIAGGILILFPRAKVLGATLRFWGALLLAAVMAGAVGTHLAHQEFEMIMLPLVLLVMSVLLGYAQRPERLRVSV